ncbi:hypothetical protein [Actinoallomurus sp. CA-142502]|uniref:hypothetical protein n=1 Tax=Actinoallomurus sp. CA-142502 TaxID=3239885 RepID=UPI003D8DC286
MKISSAILAEAFARDSRNALTLVGVGQNVILTSKLPLQLRRVVFVQVTGDVDEFKEDRLVTFTLNVTSPSGDVLTDISSQANISSLPWSDIPGSLDLLAETDFTAKEYGKYPLKTLVNMDEHQEFDIELTLYIKEPSP